MRVRVVYYVCDLLVRVYDKVGRSVAGHFEPCFPCLCCRSRPVSGHAARWFQESDRLGQTHIACCTLCSCAHRRV